MTSQGSLRHQFQRALERGSVVDAVSAAKAMGRLSLGDALALCVVLAERDPFNIRVLPRGGWDRGGRAVAEGRLVRSS